ncbi:hypothetical protein, partial [Cardiobacterium hominis]
EPSFYPAWREPSFYPAWRTLCFRTKDPALTRRIFLCLPSNGRYLFAKTVIANQLIFSYNIYANLSVFAQYSGKICMKD